MDDESMASKCILYYWSSSGCRFFHHNCINRYDVWDVEPEQFVIADIESVIAQAREEARGTLLYADNPSKPFMDYRCITDTTSKQYEILQNKEVNYNGTISIDGYMCAALGSKFGEVGDKFLFLLEEEDGTRKTVKIIKADEKQMAHTENGEGWFGQNGHVLEMIVSTENLPEEVQVMGDCNYIEQLKGRIIAFKKI